MITIRTENFLNITILLLKSLGKKVEFSRKGYD